MKLQILSNYVTQLILTIFLYCSYYVIILSCLRWLVLVAFLKFILNKSIIKPYVYVIKNAKINIREKGTISIESIKSVSYGNGYFCSYFCIHLSMAKRSVRYSHRGCQAPCMLSFKNE